jgi:hypothetical protein
MSARDPIFTTPFSKELARTANILHARPGVDHPDTDIEQRKRLAANLTECWSTPMC